MATGTTVVSGLNVRQNTSSTPGNNTSASLTRITNSGTLITVTDVSGNAHWYRTTYNQHTGYVAREFVRVSGRDWEVYFGTLNLTLGSSDANLNGIYVRNLQNKLHVLNYLSFSGIDGKYGEVTRSAVRTFQTNHGLSSDGIAGATTKSVLYSASW